MDNPKIASKYEKRERDGNILYIIPTTGKWFFGGADADKVMRKCDGTRSIQEIAEQLSKETGEPESQLVTEVIAFIENLSAAGFIEGRTENSIPKTPRVPDKTPIISLWLHLTLRCNLRCKYCYAAAGDPKKDELTKDEMIRVIDEMSELSMGREQRLVITGGEPLMHEDIWDIADYAKKRKMKLKIVTNGLLVTKDNAKKIVDRFDAIAVSIDGRREVHDLLRGPGSYDGAINGLELLIEAGSKPVIGATITKHNVGEIGFMLELAKKYDLPGIAFGPLWPTGRATKDLAPTAEAYTAMIYEFRQKKEAMGLIINADIEKFRMKAVIPKNKSHPCGAGITQISVASNGDTHPCVSGQLPELVAGNVREQSLREIWENSPVLREWRETTIDRIEGCSGCIWMRFCGGACRVNALMKHGTIRAPDMYCQSHKVMAEELFWDYRKTMLEKGT